MKSIIVLLVTALAFLNVIAGNDNEGNTEKKPVILNGIVTDAVSGEALAGVEIMVEGYQSAFFTDLEGKFQVESMKAGKLTLEFKLISYKSQYMKELIVEPGMKDINIALFQE